MDILLTDLRHTLRALLRDTGFTAAVVLTLAIGVGVNTAVFGIIRSILLEPLPYRDPDRLAMVWTTIPDQGIHEATSSYANIRDWKAENRVFEDLATYDPVSLTLTGGEWPEQLSTAKVSANLFPLLGIAPSLGRVFSPEEERRQAPVVVLGHGFWQRRFGGAPDVVERTIEIAGSPVQVIGVMPEGFAFPDLGTELWLPQTLFTDWAAASTPRGTGTWRVVGRLRAGVSAGEARREMSAIAGRLERSYPGANTGLGVRVVPLHDQVTGASFRLALWTLFGAVGLVFLIACANVSHLFLVRGMDRSKEYALRVALGATMPRLIREALTESVVLSLTSAAVGLVLAQWGIRMFVTLAPGSIPRLHEVAVNPGVLAYGTAVSLAGGLLFGIAPALIQSRVSPNDALRDGRVAQRIRRHGARRLLIAGQFALAIILVFGANLLMRSLIEARRVDPGFQTESVLMANLSVASPAQRIAFYQQVVENVRAIPGVRAVGIVEDLLISGAPNRAITVEGRASADPRVAPIRIDAIAGDFFQVLAVPLRAGRAFSQSDRADAPPVAIVNGSMARRFWPGESPIGRRFRVDSRSDGPWIEVVGLVGDMHRQGPETEPIPQVFRPYLQAPSRNMNLLVRADPLVPDLAASVRTTVAAIDRTVPLYRISTAERVLDQYLVQRRFQALVLGVFSAIALLLAAIGIHGLIQHSVRQRTREIAVRMAVGAASRQVLSMILRQGLTVALPGLAAGLIGALWISEAVSALLFGVSATDLTNVVATSGLLLLTALAACYLPARRAARMDPMTILRDQ